MQRCQTAAGKGELQIIAARIPVDVQRFPDDVQSGEFFAFKGFQIYFRQGHTSSGDHGSPKTTQAADGKGIAGQKPVERCQFFSRQGCCRSLRLNSGPQQHRFDHAAGNPVSSELVTEIMDRLLFVSADLPFESG